MLKNLVGLSAGRLYQDRDLAGVGLAPDGRRVSVVTATRRGARLDIFATGRFDAPDASTTLRGGIKGHTWSPDCRSVLLCAGPEADAPHRLLLFSLRTGSTTSIPFDAAPMLIDMEFPGATGALLRAGDRLYLVVSGEAGEGAEVVSLGTPPALDRWLLGPRDRLCCGARWERDATLIVYRHDDHTGKWLEVRRFAPPDSLLTFPCELTADGTGLYLQGPLGARYSRVGVLNLLTGGMRIVAEVPGRDIEAVLLHPRDRRPLALRVAGTPDTHVGLSDRVANDLRRIADRYPGGFSILSQSRDGETWLIRFDDVRAAPRYVVWNRARRTGSAGSSRDTLPWPDPLVPARRLARSQPYLTTASDGLPLRGRLTLPTTRGVHGPPPAVLLVHGGPWARDDWAYDPDVQWLASRGYACLQVDFRGSEGYGVAHMNAADRAWGGQMQTDLVDAVRWAADSGHIDLGRVAVMGTSYGGYAALAAATMGPPIFTAAIAISAPSDLVALTEQFTRERSYLNALFLHRLGHPERDRTRLAEQSPLTHAAACHTPLLLVHGARDSLVPIAHAERMSAALTKAGEKRRLIVFPDEGHGIARPSNRVVLARYVRRFLARHPARLSATKV